MADVACVQVIWDRQSAPVPPVWYRNADGIPRSVRFHPLHVMPETEHPAGRKGLVLAAAWDALGRKAKADGMLILDGDVAIDPQIAAVMMSAIGQTPEIVRTAPVKIWPVSTGRDDWVWAHWEKEPSQYQDEKASYFSFCLTYLPKRLIESCCERGMRYWVYPGVDAAVSAEARRIGVEGLVVPGIEPVHMHW